jgi:hypothetical protein
MNTIAEKWEKFRGKVIPKEAEESQISDMKMAFYAGAFSFLTMQKEVIGSSDISEDAGIALLESWQQEINDYFKRVLS